MRRLRRLHRLSRVAIAALMLATIPGLALSQAPVAKAVSTGPLVAQVVAGEAHACALTTDGRVWCWGWNGHNQLGDGTNWSSSVPIPVAGLTNIRKIAAGAEHTCALTGDGHVKCWGNGMNGELGDATPHESSTPVYAIGLSNVVDIAAGDSFSCAITDMGDTWCWGADNSGQLGQGTVTNAAHSGPVRLMLLPQTVGIAAGMGYACAVTWSGRVYCWGANDAGQTGFAASVSPRPTPTEVPGVTNVVEVTTSAATTCVRRADSSMLCWGLDDSGQLGNGSKTSTSTPFDPGVVGTRIISAGLNHVCTTVADGSVYCWGGNSAGQLGLSSWDVLSHPDKTTPQLLDGIYGFQSLAAGYLFTCAADAVGAAWCWGANDSGQAGNGNNLTGGLITMPTTPSEVAWDTTAPSCSTPVAVPALSFTLSGTSVPMAVSCTISDPGTLGVISAGPGWSGISRSLNGGAYGGTVVVAPSTRDAATSLTAPVAALLTVPSSGTVRFRALPGDRAWNIGAAKVGPTLTVRLTQNSSTALKLAGTWSTQTAAAFSGGSTRYASKAGASASYTFAGRSISLVTTVAPNRGAVKVYVDGKLDATVDTMAVGSATYRHVIWQHNWASAGTHTVKLVEVGTASLPRVDLDAFVVVK